ncbi:thioesterase II family protein [Streptomyces sp. SHP 1-2]|uniref:thioesterase II family protein n=1 Tax=Streptomyces sp. SHP 1-2 TaxID=2769489 RepID=UPI002238F705|nr:alpha/beta fold hydrolase [Streptomyces sp. SHP 1-2]
MTDSLAARPPAPADADGSAARRWLRRWHPGPSPRVSLVALAHAGGSATAWHPLSQALAPDVETLSVQYPGRLDRIGERSVADIPALADHVVAALADVTGPLALIGHSMGSTVAFEAARRLEAAGRPPVALIVSARTAPSAGPFRHLERDDEALIEELRVLGGSEVLLENRELLRLALPPLRSDFAALAAYRYEPGPPLACPVTALVGDSDPRVGPGEMRDWADHTDAGFALHVLPGGHFYLQDQLDAVVRLVRESLAAHLD